MGGIREKEGGQGGRGKQEEEREGDGGKRRIRSVERDRGGQAAKHCVE